MEADSAAKRLLDAGRWSLYIDGSNDGSSIPDFMPTPGELIDDDLGRVEQSVDHLLADLDGAAHRLSAGELLAALRRVEVLRRRLPAIEHRLIAQVEQRNVAADYAQPSTQKLLASQLTIGPVEAAARVRAAQKLGPRVALDGQPLAPTLELVAEAQQAGHVSERHAAVIAQAMRLLPPAVDATARGDVESTLVGHAVELDPQQLARVAARVIDHLDPDGREPVVDKARRLRDLRLYARADGSYRISGELTPECGATWQPVLDSLSKPVPDADGMKDERSPGQRRHDGLLAAGQRLLRSDTLPDSGGVPASIIVRVDADDLAARSGYAQTAHGVDWPIGDLLTSIGDKACWTTVFGTPADGILAYGLDRRYATCAQTLALIARDGGCCFPGCDAPPAWSERHHIIPVVPKNPGDAPGRTDLDNLCLLCTFHHDHFEHAGWECLMLNGRPHWRPPAHLDPHRTPRRNTHWDPPTQPIVDAST